MKALREQDFDDMADRVVSRFMGGDKLAEVAAMEAQNAQLNPDQIERLVQAANTMAFLRLMDQQKAQGTPDMTGEFDPIDARQIIQHIVSSVPDMGGHDATEIGGDTDHMPLPDEMHPAKCIDAPGSGGPAPHDSMCVDDGDDTEKSVPDEDDDNPGPFPKGVKQKAKDDADKKPAKKEPPKEKESTKEAMFRGDRMRKLADVLEDQYRQAELAFDDQFSKLSTLLKRAHGAPVAAAFEKDALALHGDNVGLAVLNMVQESRGWPVTEMGDALEKCAALADRHLVDDTEPNNVFASLVKIAREASKLRDGAEHVRSLCS
jgi:hypothetical protein